MPTGGPLPSWRPGPVRDAIVEFLDAARGIPAAERLAVFDNDGTLWCERPTYVQYDYFVDALRRRAGTDPGLRDRPEYAAVLDQDVAAIGELGLARVGLALAELFAGMNPEAFAADVSAFFATAAHRGLGWPLASVVYRPMLELFAALRAGGFTIAIATGGGTEFVRAVSRQLYGVPPELVVGTLIAHEARSDERGRPYLVRSGRILGDANEGVAKLTNIQSSLGHRPVLAAGNTVGDRELLDWTMAQDGPCVALLVDHDDGEREYAYAGTAATIADDEPLAALAARGGWTTVSMAGDWSTVFGPEGPVSSLLH
jgi:phosphoserine phosphatase